MRRALDGCQLEDIYENATCKYRSNIIFLNMPTAKFCYYLPVLVLIYRLFAFLFSAWCFADIYECFALQFTEAYRKIDVARKNVAKNIKWHHPFVIVCIKYGVERSHSKEMVLVELFNIPTCWNVRSEWTRNRTIELSEPAARADKHSKYFSWNTETLFHARQPYKHVSMNIFKFQSLLH